MIKKILMLKIRFLHWQWKLYYKMMKVYAADIEKLQHSRDETISKIRLIQEELNIAEEDYKNIKG